jgi:hypothetical protein
MQFEYCFSIIYLYIDIYGYGMLSMGFDCCLEELLLLLMIGLANKSYLQPARIVYLYP